MAVLFLRPPRPGLTLGPESLLVSANLIVQCRPKNATQALREGRPAVLSVVVDELSYASAALQHSVEIGSVRSAVWRWREERGLNGPPKTQQVVAVASKGSRGRKARRCAGRIRCPRQRARRRGHRLGRRRR